MELDLMNIYQVISCISPWGSSPSRHYPRDAVLEIVYVVSQPPLIAGSSMIPGPFSRMFMPDRGDQFECASPWGCPNVL